MNTQTEERAEPLVTAETDTASPIAELAEDALEEIIELASRLAAEQAAVWSGRSAQPVAAPPEEAEAVDEAGASLARSLLAQEDEIRAEIPDFALEDMLRKSPAFRALILAGESVRRALDYVDPSRSERRAEEAVLARIRKRNARPLGLSTANRPAEIPSEDRLNEAEMRRIDEQLKRGRKVYLD